MVPEEEIAEPVLKIQDFFPKCMQCGSHHEKAAAEPKREENAAKRRPDGGEANPEQKPRGNKKKKKRRVKHEPQTIRDEHEDPREDVVQKVKHAAEARPPKEDKAAQDGGERPKRHFQRRRRPGAKKGSDNAAPAKSEV